MGPYKLKGFRSFAFFGSIAGLIGLALYPTVIYPYFHIQEYSKLFFLLSSCICDLVLYVSVCITSNACFISEEIQKVTRAGIDQEAIQPGGTIKIL